MIADFTIPPACFDCQVWQTLIQRNGTDQSFDEPISLFPR
jgi:hypothetical protein